MMTRRERSRSDAARAVVVVAVFFAAAVFATLTSLAVYHAVAAGCSGPNHVDPCPGVTATWMTRSTAIAGVLFVAGVTRLAVMQTRPRIPEDAA
jgi:hypothetical protein